MQERDKYGRFKAKRGKVYHSTLNKWSDEGVKAEYNRLRSIALKRNRRAVKSRGVKPLSLPTAKQLGDINVIRVRVEQMSDDVNRSTSTVLGQKKMINHAVKTFQDKGFKFINKKNYNAFGNFMKHMREQYDITKGDMSERFVELFNIKNEYKQTYKDIEENFDVFINNTSKLTRQLARGKDLKSNRDYLENLIHEGVQSDTFIYTVKRKSRPIRRNKKK